MSDALSFVEQARRDNLAALMKSGVAPFAYRYQRSHLCGEAALLLADGETEGEAVSVAGRIVAWRAHGKSIFAHLADHGGRIQLYFKSDALGDAYASLAHFDLGDVVGAEGGEVDRVISDGRGRVDVDEHFQTSVPGVFASAR